MLDFTRFSALPLKCAGLGEVLFDVYASGPKLGGAPANFAFHLKQMGLETLVISAVGRDELGQLARNLMALNFLPALLLDTEQSTGYVKVQLDAAGVPSYHFADNTAYDNIPEHEILMSLASQLNVCCFGSLAQRNEVSRRTIMKVLQAMPAGCRLRIFDVNLRSDFFTKEIIDQSLDCSEVFKCNEDELPVLCYMLGVKDATAEGFFRYLQQRGINCLIFTEGSKQSTVFINDEVSLLPTPKINAIDTVGAGDSFTASLIGMLLRGRSLKEAHARAVQVAAYVCTQRGAMPVLPQCLKA